MEAVSAGEGGLKVRPELMERERMYHCVMGERAYLVFKDSQDVLSCYEIDEPSLVSEIRRAGGGGLEGVLEAYMRERNIKS